LVEIKAANVVAANKEQRRLFEFSMRVSIKRPQSGPAPAASAAPPAAAAAVKSS
jgi:type IV pilus assembly protein PilN